MLRVANTLLFTLSYSVYTQTANLLAPEVARDVTNSYGRFPTSRLYLAHAEVAGARIFTTHATLPVAYENRVIIRRCSGISQQKDANLPVWPCHLSIY